MYIHSLLLLLSHLITVIVTSLEFFCIVQYIVPLMETEMESGVREYIFIFMEYLLHICLVWI